MEVGMEKYRVFYAAALHASLTKAANELHITQPAVSQSIRALERHLGFPLFHRVPKGVELTTEGAMLYKYVEQAMTLLKMGEERLTLPKKGMQATVSVGASDMMSKHVLIPELEAYCAKYPDVQVRISNKSRSENLGLLKEGKLDFCIWNLPIDEHDLEVVELYRVQNCFVAGEAFSELRNRTVKLEELVNYPLLMQTQESYARRMIDAYLYANGIKPKPVVEFANVQLLAECAMIGLGVACVTRQFVTDYLESGKVFAVRLAKDLPERTLGLAYPPQWPLSEAAANLIRMISGSTGSLREQQ